MDDMARRRAQAARARARARALAAKRKKQKQRLIMIAAASLIVIAVILIIVLSGSGSDNVVQQTASQSSVSDPEPVVTASEPTPVPTPGPTPQPIIYLPVRTELKTDDKVIAITVDDCFQEKNLEKILDICAAKNAKITLFPIGHVIVEKPELQEALRRAHSMGIEIENHTYDHAPLYSMDDTTMAESIFRQNMAVNKALGVDYEMHFLRLMGGNGENDLRTHQYLVQLGNYLGIAHWTYSGSDADIGYIKKRLSPGMIYLFHTTDKDLKKLKEFIPYAVSKGYRLVTLNELYGYGDNATRELTYDPATQPAPTPYPFVYTEYVSFDTHSKMYSVQILQRRLQELGWLPGELVPDGNYGEITKQAVSDFQTAAGITVDGFAGKQTQAILFADDAPRK